MVVKVLSIAVMALSVGVVMKILSVGVVVKNLSHVYFKHNHIHEILRK